jgi:hypothetical protein
MVGDASWRQRNHSKNQEQKVRRLGRENIGRNLDDWSGTHALMVLVPMSLVENMESSRTGDSRCIGSLHDQFRSSACSQCGRIGLWCARIML